MAAPETPIGLQTDNVTSAGVVRTITVPIVVNGQTMMAQMQVVALADATGALLADWRQLTDPIESLIDEIKQLKVVMAASKEYFLLDNDHSAFTKR